MENIYDYIEGQKVLYEKEISLEEGWDWSMKKHIRLSYLYLNGQFEENNEDRTLRPNRNIVLPIMNVQFRTEDVDVKDIELFVDNPDEYYKSFLIKKYHNRWVLENSIDTFIDRLVVSYCTYGGALIKKTKDAKPEVIDLKSIAFCNQRDVLSNPFGILHKMSFTDLRKMKKWGLTKSGANISIDELIELVKKQDKTEVDIFEVHGEMPVEWLEDGELEQELTEEDVNQIQIVSFYKDENNNQKGVCLFKKRMPELPFKMIKRDEVEGRALGRGGVEELFEPQIWTNFDEIKIAEMLESASKTILASDDPSISSKHPSGLKDLDNLEIVQLTEGKQVGQLDTYPRNLAIFNDSINRWQEHGQIKAGATDPLLGEEPNSGTPFKLYEAQQIEGKGMHHYRQGKIATFLDEVYRDWILPKLSKEIVKERVFLSELSADEMMEVSEKIAANQVNNKIIERILNGETINPGEIELLRQETITSFTKNNNKFIKILENEMKDIKIDVFTNIAGKQKNLALLTDKIVNVLRQYISTPQIRQDPEMGKLLNQILESSGLSPIMFNSSPAVAQAEGGGGTEPLKELADGQTATRTNQANSQ